MRTPVAIDRSPATSDFRLRSTASGLAGRTLVALVALACIPRSPGTFAQGPLAVVGEEAPGEAAADEEAVEPRPGIPADRRAIVIQQAGQIETALFPGVNTRLALLRTLHPDLPPEERHAIRRKAVRAVREAAMRESELQFAPPQAEGAADGSIVAAVTTAIASTAKNLFGVEKRSGEPASFDPRASVSRALLRVVEERLGADAARKYGEELAALEQRRRDAVIRRVVAVLDADLVLSDEQCEAIEEALRDGWSDVLEIAVSQQMVQNGRGFYPGIPRRAVHGLLTDSQRERFGGAEETPMERANRENWQRRALFVAERFVAGVEDAWWKP